MCHHYRSIILRRQITTSWYRSLIQQYHRGRNNGKWTIQAAISLLWALKRSYDASRCSEEGLGPGFHP